MNKTYRLIWNELTQSWVAVSEIARSRGKRSSKALILAAALSAVLPPPAFAQVPPAPTTLPTGGNVVAGTANVTQNNAVMNINQSSQRAAIDWNTFNVGAAATVNFNQPSASAVTLNRVADPNPSQIFGRINANGQVFLSNPNGVVFGPSASLDVGGLVATTHRIGLDDFMAGKTTFSRDGATGSIINEGELKSKLGGYIALLAPGVRNQGVIVANMGTVALAAGETFELQFDANNTLAGLRVTSSTMKAMIDNKSVVLAPGGLIILSAKAVNGIQSGVINNSGLIEATGLTKRGGRIILEASNSIENTGTLSANASTTGPAGSVSLSAPEVVNSGTITATGTAEPSDSSNPESNQTGSNDGGRIQINAGHFKQTAEALLDAHAATKGGTVTLAASSKIELAGQVDVSAVAQESNNASGGEITAQAAQIDLTSATLDASGGQGGRITLDASGAQPLATSATGTPATPAPPAPLPVPERGKLILSGTTQLNTRGRRGTGGDQTLLGDHIGLNDTTALDATGATGGGTVRVGGGWQGIGGTYQATTVTMQAGATVDVSATQSGNGGTAVLWSDVSKADSVTSVAGSILAKGGAEGGDGGKVETSGHTLAIDGARVNAAAGQGGTAGDWLLDPANINIVNGGADGIGGSSMDADVITTALNGGTSVTLSADADITVNEAINWSSNQKLTLTAGDEIYVNAAISNTNLSAGGVYFQTSSAYNKVIFGGSGNVVIYNPEQLQWVNTALKGNYTLGSNIDMTGRTFVPIGSTGGAFSGFFDGLNHTISNLTITASTTEATGDFQGLFGYAYDPTIQNIGLVNVSITGRDYVGGLVGASVSTGYVNNCYVTGTGSVAGRDYTGGLIGYQSSNSTSTHNYSTVSVSGRGGVGGLVGYSADSLIDTSYATGRVDGAYGVGGLVGLNAGAGTINQTYSTGYVAATTTDNVGGLVGFQAAGAATNFSFWDDYTSGRTTSAGGTRATTAQMKDNGIYLAVSWNMNGFASGWYPIFRTDGGGVWQIAKPIVYTIPTASSTYTYTGGSQFPANWTADVIFGTDYNNWARGSDYVLKQNGNIITSYTNAGTYENITVDIIKLGYNEASAGNTNGTFAISKAPLTLSASNATKVYGDANPAFTTTLSGFVAGQTLATSGVSGAGSASSLATATSNVGTTYAITPTIGTLSATNYAFTNFVDGALSVTPRAVTLAATKVYDGTTDLTGDVTITTGVGTQTLTYTGATASDAHVSTAGKYVSALTLADATDGSGGLASNYALPTTLNFTNAPVTINAKALTVTAPSITGSTKTYDGLLAASGSSLTGGSISGLVGNDTGSLDTSGVTLAYNSAHVASATSIAASGSVALSLTGTAAGTGNGTTGNEVAGQATDYSVTTPTIDSINATITPVQLTATASITAAAKTYDGLLAATGSFVSGDLTGELNGDSIALDISDLTLAFSDAHAATPNKTISATGNASLGSLTASGVGSKDGTAGNAVAGELTDYALAAQPTISPAAGTINAKTITVTAPTITGSTKTYDGLLAASGSSLTGGSVSGFVGGDTGSLDTSGVTLAYNSAHVASATSIAASGSVALSLTGTAAGTGNGTTGNEVAGQATDYSVTNPTIDSINATITPVQLTATASITAAAKTYDGLLAATGSTVSGDLTGEVGTDAFTLDTSAVSLAYSDAHVATANKTIAATGNVALGSLTSSGSGNLSGSDANNLVVSAATDYALSAQPAIQSVAGSIIAKQLTATASITAAAKTYDGLLAATGSTASGDLTGELNGDSIALDTSGLTLAFSDAHVATANKAISATGNVALGSLNAGGVGSKDGTADNAVAGLLSDYVLAAQPTISPAAGTINAKTLTSSISNSNVTKVYDGTTNAPSGFTPTWSIDGLLSGDTAATLAYSGADYNSANVASASTLTVSELSVSGITGDKGSQASDYVLDATSKDVGATISKATLTVRADNDAKFVTQADTANFAGVSYSGFVNAEGADVLGGTAAVTRTNAGTETANVYSGVLQASGLTADNYQFSYVNGDFTIVPSSQLLVRVTDVKNSYGSASNYSIVNASYWNGTSEVVLATPTANGGNNYTVNDGAGGSATFTLTPSGATNSSAGFIKVGNYQLATSGTVTENSGNFSDTITVVGSHQVNTKALTASATGGISKTYDGTTSMSGVTLALTGKETNDVVTVGGQGAFSDKNATANLSYTFNNLVLSGNDAGNYYLSGGGSFTGNDGQILKKTVTLNPQAASRDYNGATAYTPSASDLAYLTSLLGVSGDSVNAATLSYDSKNVGIGKTLSLGAATISDGNGGNNYTITLGSNASSAITRLASVTWVGPASGGDWFDPANWANGAVPDLSNVANVVIPNGSTPVFGTTVVAPAESGPVNLDSIGTDGGLIQNGGTLNLGGGGMTLNTFTQSGGILSSSGNIALTNFNQTDGTTTTTGGGNFTVNGGFSQGTSGSVTVNGNTSITDTSGGTVIGNLTTNGSTTINSTGGDVTQANGTAMISNGSTTINASNGGAKADITLNGSGNNFVGPFNADGQNITVVDGTDGLNLGNITAIGKLDATAADIDLSGTVNVASLDLEATSGNITQSNDTLTVTSGPTNLRANGNITLDKANSMNGSVTATATTGTITISTTGTTGTSGTELPFIPAPTPPTQIPGAVGDPSTNGTPGTQGNGLELPPIPQQSSGSGNSGSDSASGEGSVTQVGTGGISISLDSSPGAGSGLTAPNTVVLTVSIPRAMVTASTGFSFEVPAQVRERIGSAEAVATRADGTALPDWLRFNPATLRFEAGAVPSSGLPLQVLISTNNTQVLIIISERQE